MNIDSYDRKILHELSKNARIFDSQLAKKVRLHRQTVKSRISQLEAAGIIKGYETRINFQLLGIEHFEFFFVFDDFTGEKRKNLISYFVKHPYVRWVGEAFCEPHLRVNFLAKDNEHIESLFVEIEQTWGTSIKDYWFNTVVDHFKLRPGATSPTSRKLTLRPSQLDAHDISILEYLSNDARANIVDVAKQTSLTTEAVRLRKKELEDSDIIMGYTVNIDVEKIDQRTWVIVYVRTAGVNARFDQKVKTFVAAQKNFANSHKMFGDWHYHMSVVGDSQYDVHRAVLSFSKEFSGQIRQMRYVQMFRGYKYPKIGVGIFDILRERLHQP